MTADVAKLGDAARGERLFRRADLLCLKCHALGGAGGQVGPDLSSIGASAPGDYLIESILDPSKAIKENYHALIVTTSQGKVITGIKVAQTSTSLILRNERDLEVSIPLKSIEEQTPSKASLMPDGLADTLTRAELLDLVRFLSELGKVGSYSIGKARVARRWEALRAGPEAARLLAEHGEGALARKQPTIIWDSAYSTVAGLLPLEELSALASGKESRLSAVRCQIEAAAASKALLRFNSVRGLRLWLDGREVPLRERTELRLAASVHELTFLVDRASRREGLRVELEDTPETAGVRFVGGK
jgi:putative heme-binding domain-containing protein